MKCRFVMFVVIAVLTAQTVSAQNLSTFSGPNVPAEVLGTIKRAGEALGMSFFGNADNIITVEYWGSGMTYAFGQAFTPGAQWPSSKVTDYHVSIDYSSPISMRVDYIRNNPDGPIRGGGGLPLAAPQRNIQVVVIEGNAVTISAWNETEPGGGTITPALAAANDRHLQYWTMTPYAAIKGALEAGENATVSKENGATVINFPVASAGCLAKGRCDNPRITFKVTLDSQNMIQKVEARSDNPVFGDMVTETTYSDYKDVGVGKMFPGRIVQKQGGFPTWDLTISKVDANYPPVYIRPPADVRASAQQQVAPKVDAQKMADGVWYLTGGTHHSVAVEFRDHVALVECPQNEERAMAVINTVKTSIPNKPIRYVVNTHHHFDHLGGLRACAAESATVITQAANKSYYEKVWAMPHTISPDRLAKDRKKPVIEGVADKRVLTDGNRTLELYKLQGTNHADTMLIGYLPKEKILIEADVYTPAPVNAAAPAQPLPENVNLNEQIQRLKLDVQQIAPLHGRLVTIEDLRKAIGRSSN